MTTSTKVLSILVLTVTAGMTTACGSGAAVADATADQASSLQIGNGNSMAIANGTAGVAVLPGGTTGVVIPQAADPNAAANAFNKLSIAINRGERGCWLVDDEDEAHFEQRGIMMALDVQENVYYYDSREVTIPNKDPGQPDGVQIQNIGHGEATCDQTGANIKFALVNNGQLKLTNCQFPPLPFPNDPTFVRHITISAVGTSASGQTNNYGSADQLVIYNGLIGHNTTRKRYELTSVLDKKNLVIKQDLMWALKANLNNQTCDHVYDITN